MEDVKKLLQDVIKVDPTMISLLGITASDSRVYPVFNPNAPINSEKKGYIVYQILSYGEAGGRIRQPIMRLQVWALQWGYADNIRSRLLDLFDKKKLTTTVVAGRGPTLTWWKQVYENDTPPEATSSTNYPGKTVDFRIGYEDAGIN
jgi:hypothetical protein